MCEKVYDYDWQSLAEGKVIPHGLYNLNYNLGYMNLGTSHDTSELAADSIRHFVYTLNYDSAIAFVVRSLL